MGNHDFFVENERKAKVPEIFGMDKRYYSFESHGWKFLVLDGNELSIQAHSPHSMEYAEAKRTLVNLGQSEAVNAKESNGGIGPNQMKWLKQQLNLAETNRSA
ncbi:MAG: hypothetical protein HC842_07960, partial [Cytophagales bacterium]|nr:hypothetical protein [Cytophagales bacterium]